MTEGDYCIVTSKTKDNDSKKQMVIEQLSQLGLDGFYEVFEVPVENKKGVVTHDQVLISIKIPDGLIDEHAKKNDINCALRILDKTMFVKAPYDEKYKPHFTKFDSCEKLEAIEEFLKGEIDFEYYAAAGVIEDHYPLHKRKTVKAIQDSF